MKDFTIIYGTEEQYKFFHTKAINEDIAYIQWENQFPYGNFLWLSETGDKDVAVDEYRSL